MLAVEEGPMKSYGQFCPVAKAAELFCERWTPLIVRDLAVGASRFSELQRGVPLMSPTLLSRRLKQLEAEGVVERRRSPGGKSWTYHLTGSGREFVPLIEALGVWGQRWSRRQLAAGEVDLGLLIWSLERSVDGAAFGAPRGVVRLELADQPAAKRLWWFVHQDGGCELCLEDPGFEVDLYLACSLVTMIRIVRGDLALERAIEGRLEVIGTAQARRALRPWLNLSPLTAIPSQRPDAEAA
jgi:DNA-binding HxlR family transcriptional regulator